MIILTVILIGLVISCGTPNDRLKALTPIGKVIWRSNTKHNTPETFLVTSNDSTLFVVKVYDSGSVSKIIKLNYKAFEK